MGLMLTESWEPYSNLVANCTDSELFDTLQQIVREEAIDLNEKAFVLIGYDSRPTSPEFARSVEDGIRVFGDMPHPKVVVYVTTPQLHYLVRCHNTHGSYGDASEDGYYRKLSSAFLKLNGPQGTSSPIHVDGANGVGADKVHRLLEHINKASHLDVIVYNDGTEGKLNDRCGADYVKISQKPPEGVKLVPGKRYCTFDGDADRILYFYTDKDLTFGMLDGDRICILLAEFFYEHWKQLGFTHFTFGVVQTAYANGSSTKYLKERGIPVEIAPTGVKHITKKAEEFDVGIAYEANGHGNLIIKDKTWRSIIDSTGDRLTPTEKAAETLENLTDLVNQCVGDALSNMLVVETILNLKKWTVEDWSRCYNDLPNRQLKVKVKDRSVVKTSWDETQVTEPVALQHAIDQLVSDKRFARAFVRPSGTEDCVRVYSEAETRELADTLAVEVACKVYELAGGTGEKPQLEKH
jgi:phosphoacetylglucosamine mutase